MFASPVYIDFQIALALSSDDIVSWCPSLQQESVSCPVSEKIRKRNTSSDRTPYRSIRSIDCQGMGKSGRTSRS